MNQLSLIRELLAATPFKPFAVCLSDGRRLPVYHPDFLTISPKGRIVWEGETDDEFAMAMAFHVIGVESLPRRRKAA